MKVYNGLALNFQQLWDTYKKDKVILILCYGLFAVALGITFAFYRQVMASWLYSDRFQYLYGIIFERKLFSLRQILQGEYGILVYVVGYMTVK